MDLQSKVASFYTLMAGRTPSYQEARDYFEEEVDELLEALDAYHEAGDDDRAALLHIAKEVGDVAFTLVGLCEALGIEYEEAADLVAESNLTKQPTPRGKVKKGLNYREPDMRGAVL